MKKKILTAGSLLILTASMFYFSGCKKTVENLFDVECFDCVHLTDPTNFPDIDNACTALGVDPIPGYQASGYTCTKQ